MLLHKLISEGHTPMLKVIELFDCLHAETTSPAYVIGVPYAGGTQYLLSLTPTVQTVVMALG
jgi:hypothetical protein